MSVGMICLLTLAYAGLIYFGWIISAVFSYMFGLPRLSAVAFVVCALIVPAAVAALADPGLGLGLFIGGSTGGLLRYATNRQ